MTVQQLIEKLQLLPAYADVVFDDGEEFRDFAINLADHHEPSNVALVTINPE